MQHACIGCVLGACRARLGICLLQALHQMLEQEVWQKLPLEAGSLPSLAHVLEGSAAASRDGPALGGAPFDTNSFAAWVARGNPWRKQLPG